MSGGYFDYLQYQMQRACDQIDDLFHGEGEHLYLDDEPYEYPEEVKAKFREGLEIMRKATIYLHRIDWLVSGDDSEESFLSRLEEDLTKVNKSKDS